MKKLCLICENALEICSFSLDETTKSGLSHICISCVAGLDRYKTAKLADSRRAQNARYLARKRAEKDILS